MREDAFGGITLAGVNQVEVTNADQVMSMLKKGSANRSTESTDANAVSSRSHAVLQIYMSGKDRKRDIKSSALKSKLSLIDLAGSERASKTNNRGVRMQEGAKINRSLLALANVISALSDPKKKGSHIP